MTLGDGFIASLKKYALSQTCLSVVPKTDRFRADDTRKRFGTAFVFAAQLLPLVSPAKAKVYFDTDTYGDKELKIATVGKIKQKLRNAILVDPSVAPQFVRISLNDALSYDAVTDLAGPDGSVQFEMDRIENKGLEKALLALKQIQKELSRTNSVTFSDIVAFAGGEAIESAGCGRVTVQVGRYEIKDANGQGKSIPWGDSSNLEKVKVAFTSSGVDLKDVVLLCGAYGEVKRVTEEALAMKPSESTETGEMNICASVILTL
jgi:hypothetical protein